MQRIIKTSLPETLFPYLSGDLPINLARTKTKFLKPCHLLCMEKSDSVLEKNNKLNFLSGPGEMRELIRSFDWNTTPLGAPDTWSQSLCTTISIMLSNRFPMFLWWGQDYISIY